MDTRGARLTVRELGLAALAACALSLVMHWPLPAHLDTQVSRDVGDPLVQAWEVAWGGHALADQPLHYFQANTFYPLHDSLAFSDALAGYAPAGLLGDGVGAAVARYNLLFLLAYALAFAGAYLLARELGARPAAAAVAGAAFAYAPWRLEQDGHLHVLSSGGIPLSLFLLLRGYRRDRPGLVIAGWLVAAWQLSLGFTLGLQLVYLVAVLAALVAFRWWRRRSWPQLTSRVVVATLVGLLVCSATAAVLARPYKRVLDDHPEAHRTTARLAAGSGPLWQFVAAPEHNMIWSEPTAGARDRLSSVPEQTLFPGFVIVALACTGLVSPVYRRKLRVGLGIGVLAAALLSLGFREHGPGTLLPYRLLYELAPGWNGIRVPGRLNTLTSLGLALLAAAGAQQLLSWTTKTRLGSTRPRLAIGLVGAVLVGAVCIEGSGFEPAPAGGGALAGPAHPVVPRPSFRLASAPAPALHLPITIAANRRYVLWSTDGFPKIVNGRGSFDPTYFDQLSERVHGFPDRSSITLLRSIGVRSVILHPQLARGTFWQDTARRRPPAGVQAERRNGVVVYRIASRSG